MKTYFGIFAAATVVCFLITPLVIRLGHRFRIYGHSHGGRKKVMLPRLGGLSIFLAVIVAGLVMWVAQPLLHGHVVPQWATMVRLLIPATLVLMVGIYDDIAGAAPSQKLLIELLAAGVAWWMGIRIVAVPVFGYPIGNQLMSFVLTVFWMLAVTNALNLIDGLDGLAAGIAFFVTLAIFIVGLINGNSPVCVLAVAVGGALLSFLWYNSLPARIFLGDTGSLFLGFLLGALAVYTSDKSTTLLALAVPYVAFGVPLLDTSLAVVRRFLSGRPVFGADTEHLHHKLLEVCSSPRLAVSALYALAALFSVGSLLIVNSTQNILVLVIVLGSVTAWFLATHVQYEELNEFRDYLARALRTQRRVVANQILIRKASRSLEKTADLEKSWEVLATTLRALDFDEVRCRLAVWPGDSVPALPTWRSAGIPSPEHAWSVSVPLHAGGQSIGVLLVQRNLAKDRMLFQFSSVLDTLVPPFEKRLQAEYETRIISPGVQYSLKMASHLEGSLLANSRGEA